MAPVAVTDQTSAHNRNGSSSQSQDDSLMVEQLTDVARSILNQAVDLLQNTLTDDTQLTYQSKYIPGSTIGKHLRHARDHYVLLAKSVASSDPSTPKTAANLSYDVRIRDTPMETSIAAGLRAFEEIIETLDNIKDVPGNKPIILTADTGPYQQVTGTTFGRELWFCSLHAIHHWSMVRVIAGELGCTLSSNFGVAPSTINHREAGSKAKI
ncbi:hypothetical protein RhiJN_14202 [Ceratobasidium sp. AG-Ba]|nr:hypothetical protein RhiJN_14202 [Ceratobasidium sp. AG-Ba]QRW14753.1 hypothetical protein RhiLY_13752 [Ceratobasidium sp. AG-Ba]